MVSKPGGHTLVPLQQQCMRVQLSFETSLTYTQEQDESDRWTDHYTPTPLISGYMNMDKQHDFFSCNYIHYVSLYLLYDYVHVRQGSGDESDQ